MSRDTPSWHAHQVLLIGAGLAYMVVAEAMAGRDAALSAVRLFDPASGLALTFLVLGGRHLLLPLFVAALLSQSLAGAAPTTALIDAGAAIAGPLVGSLLLLRWSGFDKNLPTLAAVSHLLMLACGVGSGVGALLATAIRFFTGELGGSGWLEHLMQAWMGPALGMMLVTPFLLSYRHALRHPEPLHRFGEGILVWSLSAAAAWLIFAHTPDGDALPLAHAYWMFLFVNWSGARLGLLSTTALLYLIALVALFGVQYQRGFFAGDLAASHGFGYWSYMMILATAGLSLCAYLAERRRQRAALRVAAIAFECQEGLLITDKRGRIIQANRSFLHMSGYALKEVLGRTPDFMASPAPRSTPQAGPQRDSRFIAPRYFQRRMQLSRKSGTVFPAWITSSPVGGAGSRVANYVITVSDFSSAERREQARRDREQAHRQALVQEVHHRIKNNLQGIMGMLRELDEQQPVLHEPIDRMIDHLNSIAVIHGLQGRAQADEVRLCELTAAIASGIEQNWSTPITLDIPAGWQPWRVSASQAVAVALVLNELIVNAVKHGGQVSQDVRLVFSTRDEGEKVRIVISNPGSWPSKPSDQKHPPGMGWGLVQTLLPRHGITLKRSQAEDRAALSIDFEFPVVYAERPLGHAH